MKRTFLITLLSLIAIVSSHAQDVAVISEESNEIPAVENRYITPTGYRAFIEVTPIQATTSGANINIHTIHGKQLRHSLFLGGGVGINISYSGNGFISVPVYFAIQSNVGKGLAQFTYGGRLGVIAYEKYDYLGSMGNEEIFEGPGLYSQFNLGLRLAFSQEFALSIKPEIQFSIAGLPCIGAGLTIGVDF